LKFTIQQRKKEHNAQFKLQAANLPASPGFCPHLRFISLVRREVVAVETIASVNLFRFKIEIRKIKEIHNKGMDQPAEHKAVIQQWFQQPRSQPNIHHSHPFVL
jgi:hypothetical protein